MSDTTLKNAVSAATESPSIVLSALAVGMFVAKAKLIEKYGVGGDLPEALVEYTEWVSAASDEYIGKTLDPWGIV
ncbi:hypothetical protein [Mycobacterium sp. AZCC_0083]|uniref:hypothetical protein n=1 Tax=Mycobacterium sp. AZCC_0083 TaxID=2735882 RepID=UPI00160B3D94|nr:hypothetical protein [Mycobacterium sp. AZCC_0083]MBB5167162.1 hypothetical protein [Mycobacterium sp. AZCC_0083]